MFFFSVGSSFGRSEAKLAIRGNGKISLRGYMPGKELFVRNVKSVLSSAPFYFMFLFLFYFLRYYFHVLLHIESLKNKITNYR